MDWEDYYAGKENQPAERVAFWRCQCGEVNATVVGSPAQCVTCRALAIRPALITGPVL